MLACVVDNDVMAEINSRARLQVPCEIKGIIISERFIEGVIGNALLEG